MKHRGNSPWEQLGGSNSTRVSLRAGDKDLTGLYKCEVSADAPLFHTAIRQAHLVVTVEPESGPEIQLEKTKYSPGERMRANCSSRPAFPAANLTFYLNGNKVERDSRSRLWYYLKSEERGLESSRLEVETPFPGGSVQLSCRASQFQLFSRTAHAFLAEESPLLAHVLGQKNSPAVLPEDMYDSEAPTRPDYRTLSWLVSLQAILIFLRS